jgi:hypothetical protein
MPTDQILTLLIQERDKLTQAIEALQAPKRRGRPPKNPLAIAVPTASREPTKRKRRRFTAAQRKQQGERMRQYWKAKKKTEAKSQPKKTAKKTPKKSTPIKKAAKKRVAKKTAPAPVPAVTET